MAYIVYMWNSNTYYVCVYVVHLICSVLSVGVVSLLWTLWCLLLPFYMLNCVYVFGIYGLQCSMRSSGCVLCYVLVVYCPVCWLFTVLCAGCVLVELCGDPTT